MKDRIFTHIVQFFKYRFIPTEEKTNQAGIIENIKSGVEFKGTRLWSLIFAILIACIGIGLNSYFIVIGALLIAPLSGPLAGLAAGAAIADNHLVKFAAKNLVIISISGFAISFFYFLLMPVQAPSDEWLVRTSPTIWDVMIALFGGLAGVLSGHGRRNGFVIAGIAIATVLLLPLCTAGYFAAIGGSALTLGAIGLYLVNIVFVFMGCFLTLRILKFKPVAVYTDPKVRVIMNATAIMVLLASMFFIYTMINKEIFKHRVQKFVDHEISSNDIFVIARTTDASAKKVTLLLYGNQMSDTMLSRITTNKRFYGLHEADLNIRYSKTAIVHPDSTLAVHREYKDRSVALNEKELMTRQFNQRMARYDFEKVDPAIYKEFKALFGETKELSIESGIIYKEDDNTDTTILIYLRQPAGAVKINHKQVEKWIKARLNVSEVRIMSK